MKTSFLAFTIVSAIVISGCSHKVAVQAAPPVVVQPAAASTPEQPRAVAARQTPAAAPRQEAAAPQRPDRMTPEQRAALNEYLSRLEDALFDYDKSTIRTDATVALRDNVNVIKGMLSDYPSQKVRIEGHADERGSAEYNVALGDARARAAEDFLSTMGIPRTQLSVISYGKERPVCTEASEACWQKNRRAHLTAEP